MPSKPEALRQCYETIEKLRDPDSGCPWDLEQTHESLSKYMVEECYEFIDALMHKDHRKMKEELGDILLQIFLHSKLAEEKGHFNISDVASNLEEKIIRRHPHVFNNPSNKKLLSSEVENKWQEIKRNEKTIGDDSVNYLGGEWRYLPSLLASYKIGKMTEKIGFDWQEPSQVIYKVEEEWQELKEEFAKPSNPQERIEEEIGDLLFTVAQLARHYKIEPEQCLRKANQKFNDRFQKMVKLIVNSGKKPEDMSQNEMDEFWNKIKSGEHSN